MRLPPNWASTLKWAPLQKRCHNWLSNYKRNKQKHPLRDATSANIPSICGRPHTQAEQALMIDNQCLKQVREPNHNQLYWNQPHITKTNVVCSNIFESQTHKLNNAFFNWEPSPLVVCTPLSFSDINKEPSPLSVFLSTVEIVSKLLLVTLGFRD